MDGEKRRAIQNNTLKGVINTSKMRPDSTSKATRRRRCTSVVWLTVAFLLLPPTNSWTNSFPRSIRQSIYGTNNAAPLYASPAEPEAFDQRRRQTHDTTTADGSLPPRIKHDEDNDEAAVAARIKNGKFLERNQYWIVFVDDEEAIRQSVGDFLYDSGYQVTACADARAAVEVFQTPHEKGGLPRLPDCIVSDIRMPGGPDGLELLAYIRKSEQLQRVPVILLTAKGMTADRIAGYKAGADVYLPKPFHPEELLSAVDNAIARRRQMKSGGVVADLKQEMANIKQLLNKNGRKTVKQTNIYLTPAEREIVELLCQGCTNTEIAEARGTSKNYVTKTLKKIYEKTQTSTRTELLKWAIQTGYVSPKM